MIGSPMLMICPRCDGSGWMHPTLGIICDLCGGGGAEYLTPQQLAEEMKRKRGT